MLPILTKVTRSDHLPSGYRDAIQSTAEKPDRELGLRFRKILATMHSPALIASLSRCDRPACRRHQSRRFAPCESACRRVVGEFGPETVEHVPRGIEAR